jgi:hypothetical protein
MGLLCFVAIQMVELLVKGIYCAGVLNILNRALFALFWLLSEVYPHCFG